MRVIPPLLFIIRLRFSRHALRLWDDATKQKVLPYFDFLYSHGYTFRPNLKIKMKVIYVYWHLAGPENLARIQKGPLSSSILMKNEKRKQRRDPFHHFIMKSYLSPRSNATLMLSSSRSCLVCWNHSSGPPHRPAFKASCFGFSSSLSFMPRNTISIVSCSAETISDIALAPNQPSPDDNPWSEFARNISGEWDGFGAEFSREGQPIEVPESVVPEAYREWEVKVFDWQTQCPTLAQPDAQTFLYKSIKLLPTVGCEADAATRYSIDERSIGGATAGDNELSALAFCYSLTGSYVAVWPLRNNQLEVEHCLVNPNDKESRVRIFQVVRLAETKILLQSVKVFCELWYGPFRDGDQLGGCAIRSSGFASTPTTEASVVAGSWRVIVATASFGASDPGCIQVVSGEKVIEIVREEKGVVLLPRGLWCSLEGSKDEETVMSVGWSFEAGHAITSTSIFSTDFKLKVTRFAFSAGSSALLLATNN